jgi:ABC-type lipoprotein export system ATPase subunit
MLSLALQAGALATGAPTPGKTLNKQGSVQLPIDLSTTLPRRNSEDEASWEEGSNNRSPDSEMGSPSVGINTQRGSSSRNDTFATHATKKGNSAQSSHVALDLRAPPAVKKLRQTGGQQQQQHLELAWDFSLAVKATKKEQKLSGKYTKDLLTNVAGSVKSGQMMAVMGSSGAGKSTFLDCVSLRNQQFTGNVFINNKPADEKYYFMTGFVYQEDLFIPTMTVREHLTFHAMVRMDRGMTIEDRLQRVEDVLMEVAMSHCPDTIIGGAGTGYRGISGGEKKRLAFGTELLNNPSIIFADEPTSGMGGGRGGMEGREGR